MINIGLKLWSTNSNYIEEAKRLYSSGTYSYIELYVIPNSLNNVSIWKNFKIPFIIHASHFKDGVNLAKKECKIKNMLAAKEAIEFANILNAKYIIFHPGIAGDIKETVEQLNEINDKRILIENKPYFIEMNNSICNGATIEEIDYVLKSTNVGFCLDLGHAICAANAIKANAIEYIQQFLKFKPKMFHLVDNKFDSVYDKHYHIGNENYPIKKIIELLPKESLITLETYKNSNENLDDFSADVLRINTIINEKS
jgi:deoxyribonuclease-4